MIIDSREENSFIDKVKGKNPISGVETEYIESGDTLLDEGYAIEIKRKDLLQSITSNRLYDQLNLLMEYSNPILCIVMDDIWKCMYFSNSRWIHKAYRGTLTTLATSYPRLKVFHFQDEDELVEFIVGLDKKIHKEGTSSRPVAIHRKTKKIQIRMEDAVAMTEGISIKKSQILLKHFNSIYDLASASLKDIEEVPGFAEKSAKRVWNLLHARYEEK